VNVIFFLLGDSPVSEYYVPMLQNVLPVPSIPSSSPLMKMEQMEEKECAETSAHKIQVPENHPE